MANSRKPDARQTIDALFLVQMMLRTVVQSAAAVWGSSANEIVVEGCDRCFVPGSDLRNGDPLESAQTESD